MHFLVRTALLMTACVIGYGAQAQEKYPSRPVTFIVPFPPGGSVDLTARALAPSLEKVLGQPVIVQNRSGASGQIGTRAVAVAAPDGYTLLVSTTQISVLPAVDEVFARPPAFTFGQFTPIARLSADPVMLVVNAKRPWNTLQELIADAKKNPGAIDYSSGGLYGATHIPVEMFAQAAGIKMQHIPTQGGGPAMTAALGNHVALLVSHTGVAKPQTDNGAMRALANFGDKRVSVYADVPTLKESGIDVEYFLWQGLFAPAKTPEPILKVLREAVEKAATSPEFKALLERAGSEVAYQDAPTFAKWWQNQNQVLGDAVRAIGKVE
jgi:tripartite-type tricarboxylate transporter receptor subunit TctC